MSGCYDWKVGSVFTMLQILLVATVMQISCIIKWVDISKVIKSHGKLIGLLCLWTQLLCSDMPACHFSNHYIMSCYKWSVADMGGEVL
jgi:hypothetical protein